MNTVIVAAIITSSGGILTAIGVVLVKHYLKSKRMSKETILEILSQCNRRAIWQAIERQECLGEMYDSLSQCRAAIQPKVPHIKNQSLQAKASRIIDILDRIGRYRERSDFCEINRLKQETLDQLNELAKAIGRTYPHSTLQKGNDNSENSCESTEAK